MQTIYRSEGSASLRRIPMWLADSTGTGPPATQAGGQPQICWHGRGTTTVNTSGTLSAVSVNGGLYHVELTASEVSALGILSLHYRAASVVPQVVFAQVVNYDSGDSTRLGLVALPNAAAEASGGLITFGTSTGQLHVSSGSVGLKAQTHSDVTIKGIQNIQAGNYSDVSFSVRNGGIQVVSVAAGNYSGVSVGIYNKGIEARSFVTTSVYSQLSIGGLERVDSAVSIAAGDYSSVTIQGLSNYRNISNVTLHAGTHSGVTVQGVTQVASGVTLHPGAYSTVTVRMDIAQSFSGVTIDGVRMLATPAERSIASSLLSTSLGGTTARTVEQALYILRHKVLISGSTMTVYQGDDSTSAWTATVSTGTATIYGVDPGIA